VDCRASLAMTKFVRLRRPPPVFASRNVAIHVCCVFMDCRVTPPSLHSLNRDCMPCRSFYKRAGKVLQKFTGLSHPRFLTREDDGGVASQVSGFAHSFSVTIPTSTVQPTILVFYVPVLLGELTALQKLINYHRQRRWYDSGLEGLFVNE